MRFVNATIHYATSHAANCSNPWQEPIKCRVECMGFLFGSHKLLLQPVARKVAKCIVGFMFHFFLLLSFRDLDNDWWKNNNKSVQWPLPRKTCPVFFANRKRTWKDHAARFASHNRGPAWPTDLTTGLSMGRIWPSRWPLTSECIWPLRELIAL